MRMLMQVQAQVPQLLSDLVSQLPSHLVLRIGYAGSLDLCATGERTDLILRMKIAKWIPCCLQWEKQ